MFLAAKTVQQESLVWFLVIFGILPNREAKLLKTRELFSQFISKNKEVSSGILLAVHIEMSAGKDLISLISPAIRAGGPSGGIDKKGVGAENPTHCMRERKFDARYCYRGIQIERGYERFIICICSRRWIKHTANWIRHERRSNEQTSIFENHYARSRCFVMYQSHRHFLRQLHAVLCCKELSLQDHECERLHLQGGKRTSADAGQVWQ
jgi:hypothetical protein